MRNSVLVILSCLACALVARAEVTSPALLAPAVLSSQGSGRATAYPEQNKIITHEGKTHVAWLDADASGFWVRGRTLDRTTGEWGPVVTIGPAQDNHGGPALTIDSKGYLHIVYYPHHAPFRYQRSSRPNDLSTWEPVVEFGVESSYPVMVCAEDDTLILTARRAYDTAEGESKARMRMEQELWRKPAGGAWEYAGILIKPRFAGYANFGASLAWGPEGRLHLSARIYEITGVEGEKPLNTIGHMVSDDQGKTWKTLTGETLTLPVTPDTIGRVENNAEMARAPLNSGPLGVDRKGVPHLIYTANLDGVSHLYLATPAAPGGWAKRDLREYLPQEKKDWQIELGMGGGLSFSQDGRVTIVAVVLNPPPGERDPIKAWAHPTTEIVRFWSDDGLRTFQSEIVSKEDARQAHWLPNLERPTGHNEVPAIPGIIFTRGPAGGGLHDRNLNNEVHWTPGRK